MHPTQELLAGQPTGNAILVLSLVATVGLLLAMVRIRGIGLGVAGVLFAAIGFGHLGYGIPHEVLEFVREFGLILFVFSIGLQLGPGFFASLRQDGLRLNGLALGVIFLGAAVTLAVAWLFGTGYPAAYGLFCGASTNTPALGAVQQALPMVTRGDASTVAALAYAVSYPGGVVGIIGSLLLLRRVFRIHLPTEVARFEAEHRKNNEPLTRQSFLVENPNLHGVSVGSIPARSETGVVVSRIQRAGETEVRMAPDDTLLSVGDRLLAVGTAQGLAQFQRVVGRVSEIDLMQSPGEVDFRRVVVTQTRVIGQPIAALEAGLLNGVTLTRVTRAGLEMTARPDRHLHFGDEVQIVGAPKDLERALAVLGNSRHALRVTSFVPIFIGIALGVMAGAFPLQVPGVPLPIRLGIAGGPLLLAILLSRLGRIGPLILHMPQSANLAFRELGITLFLACVGLKAGPAFIDTVLTPQGAVWLGAGALITLAPLLLMGGIGRAVLKLDFLTLCGLLSGSMTDPPALAFATSLSNSEAPAVSYAAVYPLAMFARIFVAQVLVLTLGG
jgi:putative transport protein